MKVLLSAFACGPHHGSEPEIGWQWAVHIARLGHEVWVLTRFEFRLAIEAELARSPGLPLRFVYHDLPERMRLRNYHRKISVFLYYALWQWGAARIARRLHQAECFDRVHHITYGSVRAPSFMGGLGIPFIFGPAGGGEHAPWRLRGGYGLEGWLRDGLRDASNLMVRFDPLMRRTFAQATAIYVTSQQSLELLPSRCRAKARVQIAIGSEPDAAGPAANTAAPAVGAPFRVLYVGRFLFWKGMDLGLSAFSRLLEIRPEARLTMLGDGPEKARWQALADRLGIGPAVDWQSWVPRTQVAGFYASHHVMLFPSLHDSGGMVVLEGFARGLPVVCLALGGPAAMVTGDCGRVVEVAGRSREAVVTGLAQALLDLADPQIRLRLARNAQQRCREFLWSQRIARLYEPG